MDERIEKLKSELRIIRNADGTLSIMSNIYGKAYTDVLAKSDKGDGVSLCRLGQMFSESVYHVNKHNYEFPPLRYKDATKYCYELAYLYGYPRGAYYLGDSYLSDENYKQAEKWLLIAEQEGITECYGGLGKVYQNDWEKERTQELLDKTVYYFKKDMEAKNGFSSQAWAESQVADFYREILKNGESLADMQTEEVVAEMIAYYQQAIAGKRDPYYQSDDHERLMEIYLGDYGCFQDIEKGFYHGSVAVREESSYAAYRMAKYLMEHEPGQYERIVYYLERAVDFYGRTEEMEEQLREYIAREGVPEYLRAEAGLLLSAGKFTELAHIYHSGRVVKRDLKMALYYYIRAKEGLPVVQHFNTDRSYDGVEIFLRQVEEEGLYIPPAVWDEIHLHQKDKYLGGWFEDEAFILADLNAKYHFLDMDSVRQSIRDIEFVMDIPDDQVCNPESDLYSRGYPDELDCLYLHEELDDIMERLHVGDRKEDIESSYRDLQAVAHYLSLCTYLDAGIHGLLMRERVQAEIASRILDCIIDIELQEKIECCFGKEETRCRETDRNALSHRWFEVSARIKEKYEDFLECFEEKLEKVWKIREKRWETKG